MKRKLIMMILAGVMVLSILGCGAKEDTKSNIDVQVEKSVKDAVDDKSVVEESEMSSVLDEITDTEKQTEEEVNDSAEPMNMMDTLMIDVISQEQKEQYGDFSMELPVYKEYENKCENLKNYYLGKSGNDEFYNLTVEYSDLPKAVNYIPVEEYVANIENVEADFNENDKTGILSADGKRALVSYCWYETMNREPVYQNLHFSYYYTFYDLENNIQVKIMFDASISKDLAESTGLDIRVSSASEYENVLREAIMAYVQ